VTTRISAGTVLQDPDTARTDAAVVVAWGRRSGPSSSARGIDVDAVLTYLATPLADFKLPQYVVVTSDPLPRNPGGKLLKRTLRDATDWGAPVRGR
jgi:acyl-CoA synthetase (AMP-forming)/AMP-acid ligase II